MFAAILVVVIVELTFRKVHKAKSLFDCFERAESPVRKSFEEWLEAIIGVFVSILFGVELKSTPVARSNGQDVVVVVFDMLDTIRKRRLLELLQIIFKIESGIVILERLVLH